MWGIGLGLFGFTWMMGAIWGLVEAGDARGYIPIAGPFLAADAKFSDGFDVEQGLAIGIFQGVGLIMTLIGIVVKTKVRLPGSANLILVPTQDGGQAVLGGRF